MKTFKREQVMLIKRIELVCFTLCSDVLDCYEACHSSSWRQKALDEIYEHVCADDEFTQGISIGPVGESVPQHLIMPP
jgi:hypothetical protein